MSPWGIERQRRGSEFVPAAEDDDGENAEDDDEEGERERHAIR